MVATAFNSMRAMIKFVLFIIFEVQCYKHLNSDQRIVMKQIDKMKLLF